MIKKAIEKIIGDPNKKHIKKIQPIVDKINQIETEYQNSISNDNDIVKKTEEFKARLKKGETIDDILPEAFALVKNACRRMVGEKFQLNKLFDSGKEGTYTWNMIPYDVQLIGGIILHQGRIAEMKTGEGKTLVCTMPLYLNALQEKGAFLVTVNEYLAERDAEWMGLLFNKLGLTVAVNLNKLSKDEKKAAYQADITYGTNSEFGFDYLRDNMATDPENLVQTRQLNYAIVDEVDSILIDEARTPLIISAPAAESTEKYANYAGYIKQLTQDEDYEIDEKGKTATLTEKGISKMEKILGVDNIYTDAGFKEVHQIEQALKANTVFHKDKDYVVKDGEVVIVDEFTGRMMEGRRYSDGLHQAIEAKEGVTVKRESRTLATITFQNFFRLFNKLSGMTGTAKTEEEEFIKIYGLETVVIPTNKPITRKDEADFIFKNIRGKFIAVSKRVKEANLKGQPVLIGTVSIEKSEALSRLLQNEKVPHSVLNAKYHESEAEIIAKAGQKSAVTIATNMAGRGTDIKLSDEIKELGGLLVIGTERHESRRIDNQLRGRSGRQGDPGESQFFVSMEDDLMRLFGGERVHKMMEALKMPEDVPIQTKIISNTIESAQKKVEGRNFDIRKHLVEYDDVINKHREIIYKKRRAALLNENIKNEIILMLSEEARRITQIAKRDGKNNFDYEEIVSQLELYDTDVKVNFDFGLLKKLNDEEKITEHIKTYLFEIYQNREDQLTDPEILRRIEKSVTLGIIDTHWMEHIDAMQSLRESVALRSYAQRDPLIEYKEQAFIMFRQLLATIQSNTINTLMKIDLEKSIPEHLLKKGPRNNYQNVKTNIGEIEGELESHITNQTHNTGWNIPQETKEDQNIRVVKANNPTTLGNSSNQNSAKLKPGQKCVCENLGRNEICPVTKVKAKKCPNRL
ncbi:preprotein translocase subunit SecA [Candidatus Peregrinibacteria bacterium]|nr:preprotein translocase subunit SecA [Candidatus Peregrinibacteria bacterium]